jgi:hypothetical protein
MKPKTAEALADLESSFLATGDRWEALSAVALAAGAGVALPAGIGTWLHGAIRAYRADYPDGQSPSLDECLGLNAEGAANPRRRAKQDGGLQADLGRMMVLHMIVATIPQAAAMVARVSSKQHKASTLEDRFRRSGLGIEARADRARAKARYHRNDVEKILGEYPDNGVDVRAGKAAVRAMYANHAT